MLYLLKLKRKERVVSSTMLWQDAVADLQADAPFQKLKKSLLLLLQLLALLFLAVALARPYVKTRGVSENKIVVILDSSASMQSTDIRFSRFDSAKKQALEIVNKMGPRDTMLVITAGSKTRVVQSFTSDKRALSSAISSLKASDAGCDMRQAMVLALSLVSGKSMAPPKLAIFSDGRFGSLSGLPVGNAKLDFIKVGHECNNVAITGLDSRKALSGAQQVFIGIRNFSRHDQKFNLEIYTGDQLFDIREETLKAGQTKQEMISDASSLSGRITAKLDINDDLSVDNQGSVYLAERRKLSVLMISKGNVFLQNALNLDPRTQLSRSDTLPADFSKKKYDMVVFDGVQPPGTLPRGNYLLINASSSQGPASTGSKASRPSIIDFQQNHPVTAYTDFANIKLAEGTYLKPKPWATPLVEGEGGPLVVAGENNGRRFVQVGFDLLQSDFPLHVAFPIFTANCLDWLANAETGGSTIGTVRTGRPVMIDVPPGVEKITVTGPDNKKQSIKVTQTPVIFDDTERAGIYKVTGKGVGKEFACNLASPLESQTTPTDKIDIGGRRFVSSGKAVRTNQEYYWPLVLIVLAVLAFEWYAYHRRL